VFHSRQKIFHQLGKSMNTASSSPEGKQSPLARYFSILEIVAAHPGSSVQEIADLAGVPFPTAHRLIQGLRSEGLLVGDKRKPIELGPRLLRLVQGGSDQAWIRIAGQKMLDRVSAAVMETSYLAKLQLDQVVSAAWAAPANGLKGYVIPGLTQPLHAAASSKAILAQHDEAFVRKIVMEPLPKLAANTLTSVEDLLAELETVRKRGYATCVSENEPGVTAIACPLLLPRIGGMYSIGVMALSQQIPPQRFDDIANVLRNAAAELASMVPDAQL
jgi:DNA-binding IclR family transcriptional regulator